MKTSCPHGHLPRLRLPTAPGPGRLGSWSGGAGGALTSQRPHGPWLHCFVFGLWFLESSRILSPTFLLSADASFWLSDGGLNAVAVLCWCTWHLACHGGDNCKVLPGGWPRHASCFPGSPNISAV